MTTGCATSPSSPSWCWTRSTPTASYIPEMLIGRNIIQLPTVKTHVFTTITGAMKNAFGGLLSDQPPLDPRRHPRDAGGPADDPAGHPPGPVCRDGRHLRRRRPGPRAMRWHEKDVILASADQVAIDAISAAPAGLRPAGRSPSSASRTRWGWAWAIPSEIEIVGRGQWVLAENWHFVQEDTFASRGQKMIYHGWLKPFENAPAAHARWCPGPTSPATSTTTSTGTPSWAASASRPRWRPSGAACSPNRRRGRAARRRAARHEPKTVAIAAAGAGILAAALGVGA